jgi:hypothetical protein
MKEPVNDIRTPSVSGRVLVENEAVIRSSILIPLYIGVKELK